MVYSSLTSSTLASTGRNYRAQKRMGGEQFGRMPVLEETRTIDYVTNHNVIIIDHHGDEHFQNIKNGGRTRGNIGVKYSL